MAREIHYNSYSGLKIACEHGPCSQQLYLANEDARTQIRSARFQSSSLARYRILSLTQKIPSKVRIDHRYRIVRSLCPRTMAKSTIGLQPYSLLPQHCPFSMIFVNMISFAMLSIKTTGLHFITHKAKQ